MKRTHLLLILFAVVIFSLLTFGCAEQAVQSAISSFQSAVNSDSESDMQSALSPESSFYITQKFDEFLTYFDGNRPVSYSNYTITVSGTDADAYASATYDRVPVGDGVWFWFKRENAFFAFLFPSYKVYRYYDYGDWNDPVWKKLEERKAQ